MARHAHQLGLWQTTRERAMASLNKPRGLRIVVDGSPITARSSGGFGRGQGSGNQVMSSEGVNKPKPWLGNNALQETHVTRVVLAPTQWLTNTLF